MRSDTIHISSTGEGMSEVLRQVEAVSAYKHLTRRQSIRLRLLVEEMLGMFSGLTGETEGDFYIEDDELDFKIHLTATTSMNLEKRQALLDSSTSGKNAGAHGVMSKIRDLFARAFEPIDDKSTGFYPGGWMVSASDTADISHLSYDLWSFNRYRSYASESGRNDEKLELERSIVANLADEIEIAIRGSKVEMIVYKKFCLED